MDDTLMKWQKLKLQHKTKMAHNYKNFGFLIVGQNEEPKEQETNWANKSKIGKEKAWARIEKREQEWRNMRENMALWFLKNKNKKIKFKKTLTYHFFRNCIKK